MLKISSQNGTLTHNDAAPCAGAVVSGKNLGSPFISHADGKSKRRNRMKKRLITYTFFINLI